MVSVEVILFLEDWLHMLVLSFFQVGTKRYLLFSPLVDIQYLCKDLFENNGLDFTFSYENCIFLFIFFTFFIQYSVLQVPYGSAITCWKLHSKLE